MPIMDEREKVLRDDLTNYIGTGGAVNGDWVLVGPQWRECQVRVHLPTTTANNLVVLIQQDTSPTAGSPATVITNTISAATAPLTRIYNMTVTEPYVRVVLTGVNAINYGKVSVGIVVGLQQKTS